MKGSILWMAGMLLVIASEARAGVVLQHSFRNVYDAGAEDYLYSVSNLQKYSEWQNPPVTYWGTTVNDVDGEIIYRFNPGVTITGGTMFARVNPFDYGSSWGEASIWGSRDGLNWQLLADGRNRDFGISGTFTFGSPAIPGNLPTTLLGGTELYIKGVLRTHNSPNSSYSNAQWARSPSDVYGGYVEDVFSVQLESSDVAEPASLAMWGLGLMGVVSAHRHRRLIMLRKSLPEDNVQAA